MACICTHDSLYITIIKIHLNSVLYRKLCMLYVMESLMNFLGINLTLPFLYVLILDSDIFRGDSF